ncbi:MAG: ComEA family DNA-binding protein [Planctomycetota bacterium]|jgi:hypothetical protein
MPGTDTGPEPANTGRTGEPSRARGVPYIAAGGVALALWLWAVVWAARTGCSPVRRRRGATDALGGLAPARIDVNSAGADTLEVLPGIGRTLARRIVEEREARGPFGAGGDLMRVRGFTRELVEGIEPFVEFRDSGEPGRSPQERE